MKISYGLLACFALLTCLNLGVLLTDTYLSEDYAEFKEYKQDRGKISEIIEVTGKTFTDFSVLTTLMIENTGTMQNFTHYLDKHDPSKGQVVGCPECGKYIPRNFPHSEAPGYEEEEIPETLDQVLEDVHEFNAYVKQATFTMVNQGVTLKVALEKMKDPDVDLSKHLDRIHKPLSEFEEHNL